MSLLSYSKVNKWTSARPDNWLSLLFNDPYTSVCILVHIYIGNTHTHRETQTQTQKATGRCGAVGRSDKSIWGKLSVRNFRSNCRGQNWLLGRPNPTAEGGGQWGANVLMCGRWLGRDNGRISQSPGWLIWDGSSQPLTVGSPIVRLLIPTSHKLQTKVNLFLKGGEYRPVFQLEKVTQKRICQRWLTL